MQVASQVCPSEKNLLSKIMFRGLIHVDTHSSASLVFLFWSKLLLKCILYLYEFCGYVLKIAKIVNVCLDGFSQNEHVCVVSTQLKKEHSASTSETSHPFHLLVTIPWPSTRETIFFFFFFFLNLKLCQLKSWKWIKLENQWWPTTQMIHSARNHVRTLGKGMPHLCGQQGWPKISQFPQNGK